MSTGRLEGFSDGVIAVIMTLLVLELKAPLGREMVSLQPLIAPFAIYAFTFLIIAIYWNNHHYLLHAATRVTPRLMWSNMFLLFCLSIFPFATSWLGEEFPAEIPTAFYSFVLLLAACAYSLLQRAVIQTHPDLQETFGRNFKGNASLASYALAVICAFVMPWASVALVLLVGVVWFIPDRRLASHDHTHHTHG